MTDLLTDLQGQKFRCIVADPPWEMKTMGDYKDSRPGRRLRSHKERVLPYPTMTQAEIEAMPVADMATDDAHLWLWTFNQKLHQAFHVMDAWGFRYLSPIHWIKPSGCGCWFVNRTQTILFGYRKQCRFPARRYAPNIFTTGNPARHSEKPEAAFTLIEAVSPGPRLELFARRQRENWTCWGNEA